MAFFTSLSASSLPCICMPQWARIHISFISIRFRLDLESHIFLNISVKVGVTLFRSSCLENTKTIPLNKIMYMTTDKAEPWGSHFIEILQ